MSLKEDLLAFAAPREREVELGGKKLVVREMGSGADVIAFRDGGDAGWKFLVRCVLDESGAPVFSDDDIPALKRTSRVKILPLIHAVNEVMGFNAEDEAKNSGAGPSAGASSS